MIPIILGKDLRTGSSKILPADTFERHFHLIGSTGSGKTTAILTLLRPILMEPREKPCVFIIDRMGNFSQDLLRWIASRWDCPEHVRRRLLYIEPAREDVVLPFNPLVFETEAHEFYQVERAVNLILRAWESQDLASQPRLRKWTFNAFAAAARLALPLAICRYLIQPGSDEHTALLNRLPDELRYEWMEILRAHGNEAVRILESTRNRIDPFYKSVILRRMFGSRQSRFDVERFIRERRIVILNLASYNRLPTHLADTIGALALNEVLTTALNMPRAIVRPTYLVLDEFQKFVGPDIYDAIPTVRQQGIRLVLSHQSFSQLEQGDVDLSALILQARSRLIFACDAEDADFLANEMAHLTYDPMRIKHQIQSHRQRIAGYTKEWLRSRSSSDTSAESWSQQSGTRRSDHSGTSRRQDLRDPTHTAGSAVDSSDNRGHGRNIGHAVQQGEHEQKVPIHEDFYEVSNVTFVDFEQTLHEWGRRIRLLRTGEPLGKFVDDPNVYQIAVDRHEVIVTPRLEEAVRELIEKNFASDVFLPASTIDREAEAIRLSLLQPGPITIQSLPAPTDGEIPNVPRDTREGEKAIPPEEGQDPFRG